MHPECCFMELGSFAFVGAMVFRWSEMEIALRWLTYYELMVLR